MKLEKKILLIGAGNMGTAIGEALIKREFISSHQLSVVNPSPQKLQKFIEKGCLTASSPDMFLNTADIIIFAVKPQILKNLLKEISGKLQKNTLLVSIAAGISVSDIQEISGNKKVVRVMPNTPLIVGEGISGYFCSSEISQKERGEISQMIESFGVAILCETEEKINSITALSGSGPAYFFHILESMSAQAESFGFSKKESSIIALQTLIGAGKLAKESSDNFSQLRKNVTSKGGTTESALHFLSENNFSKIFQKGIQKAKKRAEELSL